MFSKYISITYRQYQHYMREGLKKYNIGNSDYPILLCLNHNSGICQNELSRLSTLNKSLVSKGVKKLIEQGYVYSKEDINHRQKQNLFLTDLGKNIIPDLKKIISKWEDLITDGLSNYEIETLYKIMKKIDSNSMTIN